MDSAVATSVAKELRSRQRGVAYQPLALVLAFACAGVILERSVAGAWLAWIGTAFGAIVVWIPLHGLNWRRLSSVAILIAVAAIAGAWHGLSWRWFDADEIGRFATLRSRPVCIEAIARGMPRHFPPPPYNPLRMSPGSERTRVTIDVTAIRDGVTMRPCSGRAALTVYNSLTGIRAGDRLRIFADLSAPRPVHNPGEFDFASYLRGERLLANARTPYPDAVRVIGKAEGYATHRRLDALRAWGANLLAERLDASNADLAAAVLLGLRESIEPERVDAYMRTGTIHILSISGLHVGILAALLFGFLRTGLLRRKAAIALVAVVITAYAVLTFAEPPIVRATIIVVMMCGGAWLGRRALSFNTLAAAGLLVLALNPADLFRVGTQLSFLAMGTLAIMSHAKFRVTPDPLDRLIEASRPWFARWTRTVWKWTRDLTWYGFVIWLVALPLVMTRFHLLTPIAIVLNTVVWLPTTIAMWSGFLLLIGGGYIPGVGDALGAACNWSLGALDATVRISQHANGDFTWTPGPDDWWLAGYYLLLGFAVLIRHAPRRSIIRAALAIWIGVGFAIGWHRAGPHEHLDCTFLSVGHGCAVLIELPDGRHVLYDAGHFGSPDIAAESICDFLWERGLRRLDAAIVSHNDADHYNALPTILDRFAVDAIHVSPQMFSKSSAATTALRMAIERRRIPVREISDGEVFDRGGEFGYTLRVVHPPAKGVRGNDNANSVVLQVEYAGQRILLTGDLEGAGLRRIVQSPRYDCDVLLAPHHGSPRSSPVEMAQWASPEYVVISGGFRDDLAAAIEPYEAVGAKVFHTIEIGAVRARLTAAGCEVTPLGQSRPGRQ